MQTLGTLHFLSFKDKQSVSIEHGRNSFTFLILLTIFVFCYVFKF